MIGTKLPVPMIALVGMTPQVVRERQGYESTNPGFGPRLLSPFVPGSRISPEPPTATQVKSRVQSTVPIRATSITWELLPDVVPTPTSCRNLPPAADRSPH